MVDKPLDRRARRTRRLIREALLALLEGKPVEQVTVTELCEKADINRNTFYAHYAAPEEVLHELEDELFGDLAGMLEEGDGTFFTSSILSHIAAHKGVYRVLWRSGSQRLLKRQIGFAIAHGQSRWEDETGGDPSEVSQYLRFAAAGGLELVREWVEGGCQEPQDTLADRLDRFVSMGRDGVHRTRKNTKTRR